MTGPKKNRVKRSLAGALAVLTRAALKGMVALARPAGEAELAGAAESGVSEAELTAFVRRETAYVETGTWLAAGKVLALGIGDCRNQATLLYELLARQGTPSEIVVGLTNRKNGGDKIHAWVRIPRGDRALYCDPTSSAEPMSEDEFAACSGDYLDITPEYLLKEPDARRFGIGTLTYGA